MIATFVVAASALVGGAILSVSPAAKANSNAIPIAEAGKYDFASAGCNSNDHTDPVGVLFRGRKAWAANVSDQIKHHAGWRAGGWSDHYLFVHTGSDKYECRKNNIQRADHPELPPSGRYHVRLWYIPASDAPHFKTVGTPHHEDFVWTCTPPSHAVDQNGAEGSGFDQGRRELRERFKQGGHYVTVEDWGNSATFQQCDGGEAGSSGWGALISVNHRMEPRTRRPHASFTKAALKGQLLTEETSTEWWFAYGPNSSQGQSGYPSKTTVKSTAGSAEIDVSQTISGLTPNGVYYARMFARNQDGEVEEGDEYSFIAQPSRDDDAAPGPRIVVDGAETLHAFYREANGNLGHRWLAADSEEWAHETQAASIAPSSVPHVIVDGASTLHVFFRDTNGKLGYRWLAAGSETWGQDTQAASLSGDPRLILDGANTLHVFYRDSNGKLGHRWLAAGSENWGQETQSASLASSAYPEAILDGANTLHVFFRDANGKLGYRWLAAGSEKWGHDTQPASIAPSSGPRAILDSAKTLHVFYRDTNGKLGYRWLAAGAGGWGQDTQAASVSADPQLIVDGAKTLHVFYREANGSLGHRWLAAGSGTWGQETQTTSLSADPRLIVDGAKTLHVFYRNADGKLGHRWLAAGSENWGQETQAAGMSADPRLIVDGANTLHVFFRDTLGNLGYRWLSASSENWGQDTQQASLASRSPVATTGQTTDVGGSVARIHASVNAEGSPTDYYFEYGSTTSYGSKAPLSAKRVGSGVGEVAVSEALSGLSPSTTYHYRVVAEGPEGTAVGQDQTFTTISGTAAQLANMPITEQFNGSTESLANFAADWSALGWASGANPKGQNTASGWGPVSAYSTLNGSYFKTFLPSNSAGLASAATMAVNPGATDRYFALWVDLQSPTGARAGYELRLTNTSTNTYTAKLSKWVSGTETVLATKSGVGFVNGSSIAVVDEGGVVSAWTNSGAGFGQLLSASDAAFSSGYAGLHGAGNITRLSKFKAGAL